MYTSQELVSGWSRRRMLNDSATGYGRITDCFPSIATMLFLTNLEVPVVTTAVITIASELGGFDNAGWVLASYLLGYVGQLWYNLL